MEGIPDELIFNWDHTPIMKLQKQWQTPVPCCFHIYLILIQSLLSPTKSKITFLLAQTTSSKRESYISTLPGKEKNSAGCDSVVAAGADYLKFIFMRLLSAGTRLASKLKNLPC